MFWTFLAEHDLSWERVGVIELAEFAAWARRPARNVIVLADEAARLSPRTVNRMRTAVTDGRGRPAETWTPANTREAA